MSNDEYLKEPAISGSVLNDGLAVPIAIWMQTHDVDGTPSEEVTWCENKISDGDALFIRADVVNEIINGNKTATESVLLIMKTANAEITGG